MERELWKLIFGFADGTGRGQSEERELLNFIWRAHAELDSISDADNKWFEEGKI